MNKITSRIDRIKTIIEKNLTPEYLKIEDQSSLHRGHGNVPSHFKETHLLIIIASSKFKGISKIERHRLVNNMIEEEYGLGLHALELR